MTTNAYSSVVVDYKLERSDGTNWTLWSFYFRHAMKQKDIYKYFKPSSDDEEEEDVE